MSIRNFSYFPEKTTLHNITGGKTWQPMMQLTNSTLLPNSKHARGEGGPGTYSPEKCFNLDPLKLPECINFYLLSITIHHKKLDSIYISQVILLSITTSERSISFSLLQLFLPCLHLC